MALAPAVARVSWRWRFYVMVRDAVCTCSAGPVAVVAGMGLEHGMAALALGEHRLDPRARMGCLAQHAFSAYPYRRSARCRQCCRSCRGPHGAFARRRCRGARCIRGHEVGRAGCHSWQQDRRSHHHPARSSGVASAQGSGIVRAELLRRLLRGPAAPAGAWRQFRHLRQLRQ